MAKTNDDCVTKAIDGSRFELVRGDITKQETEAVVNAANKRLAPGGGVAGAIHRAAGDQLWEECKGLGGCETGEAKITEGYELPANYVIHTVGPVYSNSPEDAELLESSYRNSLELVREKGIESVSFPALSTGAFGYPEQEAGKIAINTITDFLTRYSQPELVRLVLYGKSSYGLHKELLSGINED
ncbi:macro domain-containing protein [Candidatus Bipolaricaulota bacterium]|nr:macro domain-containing protein [Candidatus Bipolaricaulota bacterium]